MTKTKPTVTISNGNSKMGYIKSVSLPPIVTCADGCTCAKDCYANKMCKRYPSVKKSYDKNLAFYLNNPNEYFTQIREQAFTQRYFRWHVSGDIVDYRYFMEVVWMAYNLADTEFLIFTKRYDIVNEFLHYDGTLPPNLHVIFSVWEGMKLDNPHNLPIAFVCKPRKKLTEKHMEAFEDAHTFVCGGNCTECCMDGVGCFYASYGDKIALPKH